MRWGPSSAGAACLTLLVVTLLPGLTVLAGTGPRGTPADADSEPNDLFADATEVTGNRTIAGLISGPTIADKIRDIYKVQLAATPTTGDRLRARFQGSDILGLGISGVRTFLHDPDRFVLDGDPNWDALDQNVSVTAARAGFYYIVLEGAPGPSTDAPYNLTVTIDRGQPLATDGNTGPATAVPVVDGSSQAGSVAATGDRQDFYRVTLASNATAGQIVQVQLTYTAGSGLRADFYNSTFGYVGVDATELNPATGGLGSNRTRLSLGAKAAGDYFLRVATTHDAGGSYGLTVGVQTIGKDANTNCTTAVPLNFTDPHHARTVNDSVGEGIDPRDVFTVRVETDVLVMVNLTSLDYDAATSLPEILVDIWNSTCTAEGAYGSGAAPRPDGKVTGRVTQNTSGGANRTHYVVIQSGGVNAGGGRYRFDVLVNTPPLVRPQVPARLVWGNGQSIDFPTGLNGSFVERDGDGMNVSWTVEGDIAAGITWDIPGVRAVSPQAAFVLLNDTNGTIRITPDPAWTGSGYLRLDAVDSLDLATVLRVPLRVFTGNHRPVIVEPWNTTGTLGEFVMRMNTVDVKSFDLSTYFNDGDAGDRLRYVIDGPSVTQYNYTVDLGSSVLVVLQAVEVAGLRIAFHLADNGVEHTGGISLIPDTDWKGDVEVSIHAWDDGVPAMRSVGAVSLTIHVIAEREPPRWLAIPEQLLVEDTPSELDLDLFARDYDRLASDPPLIYRARPENVSLLTASVLTGGLLRLAPATNWSGTTTVTLNVTDAQDLSAETDLTGRVLPVQDPPVIAHGTPPGPDVTADEGGVVQFVVQVADSDTAGPSLSYRWFLDGQPLTTIRFASYTFRPGFNSSGPHTVTVEVNDTATGPGARRTWSITVRDVNRPPPPSAILNPKEGDTVQAGTPVALLALEVRDPDGDPVTYQWTLDGEQAGRGTNITLTDLAAGPHVIVLSVTDGRHPPLNLSVNLTVTRGAGPPANDNPILQAALVVAAMIGIVIAIVVGRRYLKGEEVPAPPPPPPAGAVAKKARPTAGLDASTEKPDAPDGPGDSEE